MAIVTDPIQYQSRANKQINAAIQEIIDRAEAEAWNEYGGRRVRFTYLSYHNDVPVEGTITRVYFDQGDEGGPYYMLFEVVFQNPRNGQDTTITRGPGGFEFI